MTQAYNLSQFANNLNSSGQLDATDGLVNAVPVANGGTGATNQSGARTNLGLGSLATLNTVGNSQIDNGAVSPVKLSTGAPAWSTGGALTLSGASATYSLNVPGNAGFSSSSETGLYFASASASAKIYLTTSGELGGYNLASGQGLFGFDSSANFYFNSGYGSVAKAFGCRAWANFNGQGSTSTNMTVRGSGNISTVYKTAVGRYRVTFANAMPDANYAISMPSPSAGGSVIAGVDLGFGNQTSSYVDIGVRTVGGSYIDLDDIHITVFR